MLEEEFTSFVGNWLGEDSTPVWLVGWHLFMPIEGATPPFNNGQQFAQTSRVWWGIGYDEEVYLWLLHSVNSKSSSLSKGYSYALPSNWDVSIKGDRHGKDQ